MKANELRIGNWLLIPSDEVFKLPNFKAQVQGIGMFGDISFLHTPQNKGVEVRYKDCTDIPLTEEILLKAGFKKIKTDGDFGTTILRLSIYNFMFKYRFNKDGKTFGLILNGKETFKKYVHQLQNVVHDLTGNELEINI